MNIVDFKTYSNIRSEYSQCASWAVWDRDSVGLAYEPDPDGAPGFFLNSAVKALNGISSQQDLDNAPWELRRDVILVAMNFGERTHEIRKAVKGTGFFCFHEESGRTSDPRIRDACWQTPMWGAYMTDLVKIQNGKVAPIAQSNSKPIADNLRRAEFRNEQVAGLCKELTILGVSSPTIIALGNVVYAALTSKESLVMLRDVCGVDTQILRIRHYSQVAGLSRENYVAKVREQLKDQSFM